MGIFLAPVAPFFKSEEGNFIASIEINNVNAQIAGTNTIQHNGPDKENTAAPAPTSNGFASALLSGTLGVVLSVINGILSIIFQVVAVFTQAAATFLDFFIYYSTNSDSYTTGFIEKAWSAVRDIANMLFIITLLYVAIKTILGLNVTNNKKLISAVVVIALVINFSLFTTKVVVDASNILAKVFYNNIKSIDGRVKDANGNYTTELENIDGQKSISVGLAQKFNPQKLFGKPSPTKGDGELIFITLLSIIVMLFMIYIFLSVAFLFLGRVVGLWISMIFSPLAFISYAVPFDIPGLGHKQWWNELLKNAFLAPIFIFFLYIIIMFADFIEVVPPPSLDIYDVVNSSMKTVLPFAIVIVLLMKAKEIAVTYSGKIGEMFISGAKMLGGLALGAATGGTALALSGTVGKLSSKAAGSEGLKDVAEKKGILGFGARMALKSANYGSKASFDLGKSPVGNLIGKAGLNLDNKAVKALGLGGDSTAGGYKGTVSRKQEKLEKDAELYKTKLSDAEVKSQGKYNNAKELNAARLKTFKDNIGKTGLMHSVAYSSAKAPEIFKKEKASDELLEQRAKGIKMGVGLAAGLATGGLGFSAGGAIGGLMGTKIAGAVTAAAGGALGIAGPAAKFITDNDAEKAAIKNLDKDITKSNKLKTEMDSLKQRREALENVMKSELEEKAKIEGKAFNRDEYIKRELIINEDEIESIKENSKTIRKNRSELETKLNSRISGREKDEISKKLEEFKNKEESLRKDLVVKTMRKFELTEAKDAADKITNIKSREEKLHESEPHPTKETYKDSGRAPASSGGSSSHKAEAHHEETPHEEENHAPAGDHAKHGH